MPDLPLYEEDRTYVIDKFHNGHFDYIEVIQEVVQRDFFRYVAKGDLLRRLADSYPSPRNKPEVPAWFYLAADMAMRLHGNHAFNGFPWVVSTGGLLAALVICACRAARVAQTVPPARTRPFPLCPPPGKRPARTSNPAGRRAVGRFFVLQAPGNSRTSPFTAARTPRPPPHCLNRSYSKHCSFP
jgi:hypothetical protein